MKIAGTKYGPPGSKRLIYFVDDINMPLVDKYDTQSAVELMRQHIDQRGWYDKVLHSRIQSPLKPNVLCYTFFKLKVNAVTRMTHEF